MGGGTGGGMGSGMGGGMGGSMAGGMCRGMGGGWSDGDYGMGGKDKYMLGKEMVMHVMDDMPSWMTQDPRGFILRSAVPGQMAGILQRKAVQVMGSTGTKIGFHGDAAAAARMMSVEGPLFNVCAAYMLMMRRYLEVESEARGQGM